MKEKSDEFVLQGSLGELTRKLMGERERGEMRESERMSTGCKARTHRS